MNWRAALPTKVHASSVVQSKSDLATIEEILKKTPEDEIVQLTIDNPESNLEWLRYLSDWRAQEGDRTFSLYLEAIHHHPFTICKKSIKILNVSLSISSGWTIILKDCRIDSLVLEQPQSENPRSINIALRDTWIGKLQLGERTVTNLTVEGGGVLEWQVPDLDKPSPFIGTVIIADNVFLPRSRPRSTGPRDGIQPWANLHGHLVRLGNVNAASRIHAVQLALERPTLSPALRVFSWLYAGLSDYGTSIARPLFWLFAATLLTFGVFFLDNSIHVDVSSAGLRWASGLTGDDLAVRAGRAALLVLSPVLDPFSSGQIGKTFVAGTPLSWVTLVVLRIAIVTTLIFLGLALRRRFRASS